MRFRAAPLLAAHSPRSRRIRAALRCCRLRALPCHSDGKAVARAQTSLGGMSVRDCAFSHFVRHIFVLDHAIAVSPIGLLLVGRMRIPRDVDSQTADMWTRVSVPERSDVSRLVVVVSGLGFSPRGSGQIELVRVVDEAV
jgi:hypothetical protein